MGAEKKKQMGVLGLVIALVVVLMGSLVFVGASAGWFDDPKIVLSEEYYTDEPELRELTADEYKRLIEDKKSFVVFVDQPSCTTADRVRGFMRDYIGEKGIVAYRMMFEDAKKTSLHDYVRYYPSVVFIYNGMVRGYLRADSDEDAAMYNDYGAFLDWAGRYLQ